MITTATATSHRITATVAAALVAATHSTNLADYGSAITADDASDHARAEGVPHMSDNHRGNGDYFERMDGSRSE